MTAYTGVGRIVVITIVAGGAIVGNASVRAVERIVIIVVGKSGRSPAGLGRMAACTIVAKA